MTDTDRFTTARLPAHWMWLRTPRAVWWRAGGGQLAIEARPDALGGRGQPSLLAVRQRNAHATVTVQMRLRGDGLGRAGLTAFQDERRFFVLAVADGTRGRELRLERRDGDADPAHGRVVAAVPLPLLRTPLGLRIEADGPRYRFLYALPGAPWRRLGEIQDGSILSVRHAGGFTGVLLGVYAQADRPRTSVSGSRPQTRAPAT